MPKRITIQYGEKTREIIVNPGLNLLKVFQDNNIPIAAPCAGNGKCGKCAVHWQNPPSGKPTEILACKTTVDSDLELILPESQSAKIQTESYFPDIPLSWDEAKNGTYGIAVDIGTTTVVVFLEDLHAHRNLDHSSFLNPQKAFGADVISRIQYAENAEKTQQLQTLLLTELENSIQKLCRKNNINIDQITDLSITGNTTMLHLFTATDPSSLAVYPFDPVFIEQKRLSPAELNLPLNKEAKIHLLPSISAFVGADIVGGIAATDLPDENGYALFIDIGTNGEMALGNKEELLCCATAAGPAFEGAKISCGLGGVTGAIHSFSESSFATIDDAKPSGLCGSGLIDVVAENLKSGNLDMTGYLENDLVFLPEYDLKLTPQDIREVQLAKGAIVAGIHTLIGKAEIDIGQINKVYLAGGFGFAINPASAVAIGLIPPELEKLIIRTGNSAGLGARLFLHSASFRERISKITSMAQHFDLSADMKFNELFVMNMHFPA